MQYHDSHCTIYYQGFSVFEIRIYFATYGFVLLSDQKINPGVHECQMEINESKYLQQLKYCNEITF